MKALIAIVCACAGLAGPALAGSDPAKLGQDLVKAAGKGNVAEVRDLLGKGAGVNAQDKDGHTALLRTAQEGRTEAARALLDAGADPNLADKDGKTPLWEAARHDKSEVVALLIAHKADLERADKGGETPLLQAISHGNPRVVDQLLAAGADTHWHGKASGSLLMYAASGGSGEVVQRILKLGGDVNAVDEDGETALFYAARSGKGEAVEALADAHAQVNHVSRRSLSPLMVAVQGAHGDAVRALLHVGALPDLPNQADKNWTALMYAAAGSSSSIVDDLAQAGADVNLVDASGDSPIHIAARRGNGSVTHALIAHGAHVNRPSGSDHKTALAIAVEANDRDVAGQLVDGGACVTSAMRDHATAKKDEKMTAILAGGEGRGCHKP